MRKVRPATKTTATMARRMISDNSVCARGARFFSETLHFVPKTPLVTSRVSHIPLTVGALPSFDELSPSTLLSFRNLLGMH
jgi:hypothetical protein